MADLDTGVGFSQTMDTGALQNVPRNIDPLKNGSTRVSSTYIRRSARLQNDAAQAVQIPPKEKARSEQKCSVSAPF
jgi:hypothetical protein